MFRDGIESFQLFGGVHTVKLIEGSYTYNFINLLY
jgi:hypothetical protein